MNQSEEIQSLRLRIEALETQVASLQVIIESMIKKPKKSEPRRRKAITNDLTDSVKRGLSGDPAPPLETPKGPRIN